MLEKDAHFFFVSLYKYINKKGTAVASFLHTIYMCVIMKNTIDYGILMQ